jgi:hypothetical protein
MQFSEKAFIGLDALAERTPTALGGMTPWMQPFPSAIKELPGTWLFLELLTVLQQD